jgi:hypothetical protein
LARLLGRAGRRAFWRLFTKAPDHLGREDVDRIWGNRAALQAVWSQVFERFDQEERVRELLRDFEAGAGAGTGAGAESAASGSAGASSPVTSARRTSALPPILVVAGDKMEPHTPALARRLGAKLVRTEGDHLFPTRRPQAAAALIADWHAALVSDRL